MDNNIKSALLTCPCPVVKSIEQSTYALLSAKLKYEKVGREL